MMRKIARLLVAVGVVSCWPANLPAHVSDTLWTKTFGGTGEDRGYSLDQTSDGGYIIAGWTESFGAGAKDVYLVRTDANGDALWTRTYGGPDTERGMSVQQTTDGGYVIGGTANETLNYTGDIYLIKTDANGDTLWTRTYGGGDFEYGYSVQQTSDSGYIITGLKGSFGPGGFDVYLIKTDANGDTLWTRTYGGANHDWGLSVDQTSDGGYITAGVTESFGAGNYDIYVIRTDANGNPLWTQVLGGTGQDAGNSVQETLDGGYIVVGYWGPFSGRNVYLSKLDANGGTLWTRTFEGGGRDDGRSVQQTADGGYIIGGYTDSFGAGSYDLYLIKTDENGDSLWTRTYGGTGFEEGKGQVQQTSDGGYVMVGSTESFGAGSYDIYVIKTEGEYCGAIVDIDPNTLNPRSHGQWMTCYIELLDSYDVAEIDVGTVVLNETVPAESSPTEIGDYDSDGTPDLMVKFSRSAVQEILPVGEAVELNVTGMVSGCVFSGADMIRVLPPNVLWPNGGEILEVGLEYQVAWEPCDGYEPERYSVYYTTDDGDTWEVMARNTEVTSYNWITPDVASTGCRVLVEACDAEGLMGWDTSDQTFSIGVSAAVPMENVSPADLAFQRIYPNPFTEKLTIRFYVPERGHVQLTVHDVHGRLVRQLIDRMIPAGSQAVESVAKDLFGPGIPAGIYFLRLQAGDQVVTRKVVLVR